MSAETLTCYIASHASLVPQWCRVSGWLAACRLTSSASECASHVLINIIVGDSSRFLSGTQNLGLTTADIDVNTLDLGLLYNKLYDYDSVYFLQLSFAEEASV